jgi:DNA invertase Pin-like site-specific DNA recombinase
MKKRLAIYARLSQDREGTQTATARQMDDCRKLAEAKGWTVAEVYEDVDLSAYRQVRRPAFERLLADLAAERINGVLVWKLDRLVRNHADFQRCWGICEEHGAMLASVHEQFDTSTPAGEFVVRMMVGMAKMESDNISLRLRSKFEELAKAGQPNWGGRRAFGLTADWRHEIPGEADAIRDAVRRLLNGESLRTIAREWQAAGIITPAGGPWGTQQLRRMLIQPRLAGFRSHHGAIVATGNWPAIIDRDTHRRLVEVLTAPGRKPGAGPPHTYLLSGGVIRCGRCNRPMRGHARKGRARYGCESDPMHPGCGRAVMAKPVDDLVTEAVIAALDSRAFADALRTRSRPEADHSADLTQLRDDEAALEQLARDHYIERIISRAEYLGARSGLEERIASTRGRLARRSTTPFLADLPSGGEAVRAAWEAHQVDWRRRLVAVVLEAVIIGPETMRGRHTLDPSRVQLIWRV